jgi:hypothetical protein
MVSVAQMTALAAESASDRSEHTTPEPVSTYKATVEARSSSFGRPLSSPFALSCDFFGNALLSSRIFPNEVLSKRESWLWGAKLVFPLLEVAT